MSNNSKNFEAAVDAFIKAQDEGSPAATSFDRWNPRASLVLGTATSQLVYDVRHMKIDGREG